MSEDNWISVNERMPSFDNVVKLTRYEAKGVDEQGEPFQCKCVAGYSLPNRDKTSFFLPDNLTVKYWREYTEHEKIQTS